MEDGDPQSSILNWPLSYSFTFVNTRSGLVWNIFNLSSALKTLEAIDHRTDHPMVFPFRGAPRRPILVIPCRKRLIDAALLDGGNQEIHVIRAGVVKQIRRSNLSVRYDGPLE